MNTQTYELQNTTVSKPLERKTKSKKSKVKLLDRILSYTLIPILILILWETVTKLNIAPPAILPSLEIVLKAFVVQIQNGEMIQDVAISLTRVVRGYTFAVILGLSFGVLMGISLRANKIFSGVFNGIRQIPPMAWIPLIILWFGIGETSKIIIISKAAFFPILLNTIDGIRNTPKGYIEVARLYNINKFDLFRKIYFPSALPSIFVGLRLGLGIAWAMVVAAELIASSSGIGYRINDARSLMQSDVMIADMIVIGIIGSIMDFILRKVSRYFSKWQAT
ncbi:ABC transporter permease [Clostridium polyendosporum]|uniref:ABC transporter permease n=1 Tax=Clostridium polyendosporum TaxID=69208 RepID=A0A919S211_9CLOT|nr:ABC transporter permease [Clostridium polyendosporum]GIM29770.1 ABC transporter permease [Clostridium polyendosporum]